MQVWTSFVLLLVMHFSLLVKADLSKKNSFLPCVSKTCVNITYVNEMNINNNYFESILHKMNN